MSDTQSGLSGMFKTKSTDSIVTKIQAAIAKLEAEIARYKIALETIQAVGAAEPKVAPAAPVKAGLWNDNWDDDEEDDNDWSTPGLAKISKSTQALVAKARVPRGSYRNRRRSTAVQVLIARHLIAIDGDRDTVENITDSVNRFLRRPLMPISLRSHIRDLLANGYMVRKTIGVYGLTEKGLSQYAEATPKHKAAIAAQCWESNSMDDILNMRKTETSA